MPITKSLRADNGIMVAFHKPVELVVDLENNVARVTVNSYGDEAAALQDRRAVAWQWRLSVPVELLAGDQPTLLAEVESVLVTDYESPFVGGAIAADNSQALDDLKANAIAKTYRDVKKAHRDAAGDLTTEYLDAEKVARSFAAGGYAGEAEEEVHSYALDNPTGQVQTDQWAAEQIIARADAFRVAQKAMRTARFKRQSEMRTAETANDLNAVVAAWDGFIAGLRAQLGL